MPKLKPYAVVDTTPEEIRDETMLPRDGGPIYWLALPDEFVEMHRWTSETAKHWGRLGGQCMQENKRRAKKTLTAQGRRG